MKARDKGSAYLKEQTSEIHLIVEKTEAGGHRSVKGSKQSHQDYYIHAIVFIIITIIVISIIIILAVIL